MERFTKKSEFKDNLIQKAVEYNGNKSFSKEIKEKIINLAVKTIFLLKDEISAESELKWLLEENISNWIWKITEAPGPGRSTKYVGQRYWSKAAFEYYQNTSSIRGLRHEHVYKRKKLVDEIVEATNEENQLREIFKKAEACVVLHEEHKSLKSGEGWERYKTAKIEYVDLLKND